MKVAQEKALRNAVGQIRGPMVFLGEETV